MKKRDLDLRELSISIMDIVAEAAGRRLQQVLEQVYEEEIKPLQARVKELETQLASAQRSD